MAAKVSCMSRLSRGETTDGPFAPRMMEDKIYVAVGSDVEGKSTLIWALQNTRGKELCIVHVHQLLQISTTGMKFPDEHKLKVYQKEREKAYKTLDKYLQISLQMGVRAEKLYTEMESIENGIVQLISRLRIRKLVMGAASDRNYSMTMRDLKSSKAIYVRQHAPPTCHMWFTCKGYLICTREAIMDNSHLEYAPSDKPFERHVPQAQGTGSGKDSVRNVRTDAPLSWFKISKGTESAPPLGQVEEDSDNFSPGLRDRTIDDIAFYACIRVAMEESQKSKQAALLEEKLRQKAEKDAIGAITRAEKLESAYSEEFKRRKEAEIALIRAKEEFGTARSFFDNRIAESDRRTSRLQHGYNLVLDLLQNFIKERDELHKERGRVLREFDELTRNRTEPSAPPVHKPFTDSPSSEHREVPLYFCCPILQEIMEDPQVAADGFTYQAEAIRKWLESGHDTSPMTNAKLPHTGLVPNLALRSAINEWLQLCKPSRQASTR